MKIEEIAAEICMGIEQEYSCHLEIIKDNIEIIVYDQQTGEHEGEVKVPLKQWQKMLSNLIK